jgi:glycosyltransferase involved in cell wall biosynthesis
MNCLRERGVDVQIFSLLPPKHNITHDEAQRLIPVTNYSPFISWQVLQAQVYFLLRCPSRYVAALWKTIRQTFREPMVLLRSLLIFPKSVHFSRLIQQRQIDHMHAHFVWLDGLGAGVIRDLTDISFTIHPHAFGLFSRDRQSVRAELENATQIVTVSNYNRDYILRLCDGMSPERIDIVHYGIDPDQFVGVVPTAEGPVQLLAVGRLVEKKGLEYLIAACHLLKKEGYQFHVNVVGDGPLRGKLQTLIDQFGLEDNVELCGAKPQVVEYYQSSHIFVLPCVVAANGDRDGMPNVLMEAMACGLPVISTPVTGIPELIEDGVSGLIVKERDSERLADAMKRLIDDPDLRVQMGRRGRACVCERFNIRRNAAKLEAIFRELSRTEPHGPLQSLDTSETSLAR